MVPFRAKRIKRLGETVVEMSAIIATNDGRVGDMEGQGDHGRLRLKSNVRIVRTWGDAGLGGRGWKCWVDDIIGDYALYILR